MRNFKPFDLEAHSNSLTGKLYKFSSLGCYPMFYFDKEDNVLCADCAQKERDNIAAADANWEDPSLYCDECSERIESAYAEDDV